MKFLKWILLGFFFAACGCATPKYAYHSRYKAVNCKAGLTKTTVAEALVRKGFLRSVEVRGPYEIFHKPEIIKKGAFAQEPVEDKSGDIAVAVCPSANETYLLSEEWRSCKDRKDCTADHQRELKAAIEAFGCQVSEQTGHSESWKLEERQDWTGESCSVIATSLGF